SRSLEREALGEPEKSRLRSRVVRLTDVAGLADDRADVDDSPRPAVEHVIEDGLGHMKGPREVDLQHLMPLVDRHLANRFVERDAGVIDEIVDAALIPEHFSHDAVARLGVVDAAL